MPKVMQHFMRNAAEGSTGRLKSVHAEKVSSLTNDLKDLRAELPGIELMKLDLDNSSLHNGKILITAGNLNFGYGKGELWQEPLNFRIASGERIALTGQNGSGKSTLLKMMLGRLQPTAGNLELAKMNAIYIDQEYSLIDPALSVYEQAQAFNTGALLEHDVRIRLNRFLFDKECLTKRCSALSGGERMRLALCCITIGQQAPDVIILDEPTNNLDMQNVALFGAALSSYKGTLIVVSHDAYFLQDIETERVIALQ